MAWYFIVLIVLTSIACWFGLSALFYKQFFKRFYDIILSGLALIVLSPVLLILSFLGAVKMRGNPFFTQDRPGKNERIFKLIKFRSMTCERDSHGELLPDEKRLTSYGKILRSTSLDELPELINIFIGDMSIVGPRPLLVKYLPLYNNHQKRRHEVRPGFTGLAQVHGRNAISWDEKFDWDVKYVDNMSLLLDLRIIFSTAIIVLRREGINGVGEVTMNEFKGSNDE